jgi:cobalamin biosynthetic protein CobC
MRDHGGNLDEARMRYGGLQAEWLDLSTGINPEPYPLPDLPERVWAALPTRSEIEALADAAQRTYGARHRPVPLAGAQAAIQILPRIAPAGMARVLGPTYNEHAAALRAAGYPVRDVPTPDGLAGAATAIVVNPNNPDGRHLGREDLSRLAGQVGLLVIDESFADAEPSQSLAGCAPDNVVILRSFGKFFGLAGLRLGFALAAPHLAERIATAAGPWAVSGPAIGIGCAALADAEWQTATRARLSGDAARLDRLAGQAGWACLGGTPLFRLYETGDAAAAQDRLARAHIWTRRFPYSEGWLRLGLPPAPGWTRLEAVLSRD